MSTKMVVYCQGSAGYATYDNVCTVPRIGESILYGPCEVSVKVLNVVHNPKTGCVDVYCDEITMNDLTNSETSSDRLMETIINIITEQLGCERSEVIPSSHFVDDLGADSLDTVEMLMCCEEQFNIEMSDEVAEQLRNVQHVYDYFKSQISLDESS